MRHLLITTALVLTGTPVLADRIEATAPVRDVTLYPWGASVTRIVDVNAPAGTHEIVIPGLGDSVDPASLRVGGTDLVIGAISVQQDRASPADPARSPEYLAALEQVRRLELALTERENRIAAIRARVAAAEDVVAFMLALAESDGFDSSDLAGTLTTVRAQILSARQDAIAAETEAAAAEQGLDEEKEALERARTLLESLRQAGPGNRALVIAVESGGTPAQLEITGFSQGASWNPIYDLRLERDAGTMTLDRGFLITQWTGEDWQDVNLTLSTARPAEQTQPGTLHPWFPRLRDPADEAILQQAAPAARERSMKMAGAIVADGMFEPVVAEAAEARMMGATVVYDYPAPVTIRTGADALRLKLDSRGLEPEIRAEAVPQLDGSAYLVAETVNSLNEVILPGEATIYADGVLVGRHQLDLVPAGEEIRLGFGPIDGLVAEYEVPQRAEGDRGLISRSNTSSETVVLRVRNLTGEEWPLRIVGQVPVSTQDDLRISWSADPRPNAENPDGQRGLMYWDSTVAPNATREITVTTEMSWPDGKTVSETSAPGTGSARAPTALR